MNESVKATVLAHCLSCHETFPNDEVKILTSGADVCPKCGTENYTCVFDGEFHCGFCGNEPEDGR